MQYNKYDNTQYILWKHREVHTPNLENSIEETSEPNLKVDKELSEKKEQKGISGRENSMCKSIGECKEFCITQS